jgi:uncharacterized protein
MTRSRNLAPQLHVNEPTIRADLGDDVVPLQSSEPALVVTTRRVSFERSLQDVARHFCADDDLIGSHTTAVLSSIFPDGEAYFVRSVRHFRDRVVDPALRQQVAGFIGQESMHGREHMVLNERLAALGYSTHRFVRWSERIFRSLDRRLSPETNLALTAAFEHFTATLAEWMMSDEDYRASIAHPAVREIFLWHALEELEHKAVAFDVYRAAGASEQLRIRSMKVLLFAFPATTAALTVFSLARDRDTYRPGVLWSSLRRFVAGPMMSKQYRDMLAEYLRPGFHPSDRDTTALVQQWRDELFGDEGQLIGLLAAGATGPDQSTS